MTYVFFILLSIFSPQLLAMDVLSVQDQTVVVSTPKPANDIYLGQVFQIKRELKHPAITIDTGSIKIAQIGDDIAIAHILTNGSEAARIIQPKANEIRSGDKVVLAKTEIAANIALLPSVEKSFYDLFSNPHPMAQALEIPSHHGDIFKEELASIMSSRLPKILVEVHTDDQVSSQRAELESIERASVVRQFLIREFKVSPDRIIALGFGSSDPKVDKNHPRAAYMNRRVIIKAVD